MSLTVSAKVNPEETKEVPLDEAYLALAVGGGDEEEEPEEEEEPKDGPVRYVGEEV
jgi:hypothetical protein